MVIYLAQEIEIYSCVESRNVVISQMCHRPYTKYLIETVLLNSAPEDISFNLIGDRETSQLE